MNYLTYEEYTSLGGVLDTTAFNRNIVRVCNVIDRETHNRAEKEETVPEYFKHLCRDMVEYYATNSTVNEKEVASSSASAGAVSESISYVSKTADDFNTGVENLLHEYLDGKYNSKGVEWRYRGFKF